MQYMHQIRGIYALYMLQIRKKHAIYAKNTRFICNICFEYAVYVYSIHAQNPF